MGERFGSEDYMLPTPAWASYGRAEAGFDPKDTRVKKSGDILQRQIRVAVHDCQSQVLPTAEEVTSKVYKQLGWEP